MNNNYYEFLEKKRIVFKPTGLKVDDADINPVLFPFQRDLTKWALRKGRSAIFADTGLGKTPCQLEWSRLVCKYTGGDVLILAPLAVSRQTVQEGVKFGIEVNICRKQKDVVPGINITNYEMLEHFEPDKFIGIVLDESSILKSYMGKTKRAIIDAFKDTKYKLCCTATPSPNDHMEILNHAEFLNAMRSHEALAIWFINDTMNMGKYRLKNYAVRDFWDWVSSWAASISKPSDLGYDDGDFELPPLNIIEDIVEVDFFVNTGDKIFRVPEMNATSFHQEKRLTTNSRAKRAADIVISQPDKQFIVWCDTNYEADALKKLIPGATEVRGSDKADRKEQAAIDFINGKIRVLISKPTIFGLGLNFQHCHKMVFCGLSFSFESFYQAVRRLWRFGQKYPVDCHVVIGETERQILNVIKQKETLYEEMKTHMIDGIKRTQNIKQQRMEYQLDYEHDVEEGRGWTAILGDSIEEVKKIESDSIHFQIFSPPFSSLYIYSDSYRDMGNVKNDQEFFKNFEFLIPELYRILMPGRLAAVHCKQLVNYKGRDGASGLRDFRGEIIRAFQKHGYVYHSEVCIWKDPVIEMQRTKSHGLLYKQLRKDSSYSRQGLPDYLLLFRKWGDGDIEPVTKTKEGFPLEIWQRYASPVWFDIRQTNVLNCRLARDNEDEKHICLAKGTLVLTQRGYIAIENIDTEKDYTLTHLGNWKKIIAKEQTRINAEVVQVKAMGVPNLICTPDHKIWSRSILKNGHGFTSVAEPPEFIEAKYLENRFVNLKLPPIMPSDLNNKELWLMGRWIADGHWDSRGHELFVSIGIDKWNEYQEAAKGYIGARTSCNTNSIQCSLVGLSNYARMVLRKCGKGASNKLLPIEITSLDKEKAKSFLDGYISGDGHISKDGRIHFTSVSRALLLGIAILYQRVYGKPISVYAGRSARKKEIQGRIVNCKQEWVGIASNNFTHAKLLEDGVWKRVKSVEPSRNCDVWSIEVEDDNSFTAEGCIVKNCPLQLEVIERAIDLWTNPGDIVFSPFMGIGSEGYQALKMDRQFVGIELKRSYYEIAVENFRDIIAKNDQQTIFDLTGVQ